tara:strand:- start:153 stop:1100 length:948 start_codon:yes stop_codon:yes gene_type:complete
MKKVLRKLFDFLLGILIVPLGYIILQYKKRGPINHPFTTSILQKIGIFPIMDHYYEPKFNFSSREKINYKQRYLNSINMNSNKQLKLLNKLKFSKEIVNLNFNKKTDNFGFYLKNGSFEECDSEIYYQILRYFKPKKVVEIGSGYSTLVCLEANKKNFDENNLKTKLTCIEPFENKWLKDYGVKVIRKKLEDINIDWKNEFKKNDIIFLDSSHIIRPNGDVLKFFLEILPQLSSGVIVHIHDIFTPRNYRSDWIFKLFRLWNEQYILEAILANSKNYEVMLSLNFLKKKFYRQLKPKAPNLKKSSEPSSIYLKVL